MGWETEKLFIKLFTAGMAPSQKSAQMPRGRCGIRKLEASLLSFPHKGKLTFTKQSIRSDQAFTAS